MGRAPFNARIFMEEDMVSVRPVRRSFRAMLLGMAVSASLPSAQAQEAPVVGPQPVIVPTSWGSSPYCPLRRPAPSCCESVVPGTVTPVNPVNPVDPANPNPVAPPPTDINTEALGTGPRGGAETSLRAPNMQGDLLHTTRSVSFGFVRTQGDTDFIGLGSTNISNASVAENNSPVPADRLYFRYNYFKNGQSVTGLSQNRTQILSAAEEPPTGIFIQQPETKRYNVNMYTFGVEKTFADGLFSAELRAPVVSTLASHNTFSVADFAGFTTDDFGFDRDIFGNRFFNVTPTPQNTLGHSDTEFGDLTLVLKAVIYQNPQAGVLLSGGAALGIPTAPDTRVRVIDVGGSNAFTNDLTFLRQKDVVVSNDTWSLSPFVAALWVPNDRFFAQGFLSVETPLNGTKISYSDRYLLGQPFNNNPPAGTLNTPFQVGAAVHEQTLMHLDLGAGYWAYRRPENRWLTGIAPDVEVHYTTTLNKSRQVQLPGEASTSVANPLNPIASIKGDPAFPFVTEAGPLVGTSQGHMNILDLTLGTTFEFGPRVTLAPAFTVPLTNGSNRTFDWEFQLQLNYYFGANR